MGKELELPDPFQVDPATNKPVADSAELAASASAAASTATP
jgi:hypothetical protein